ncbi:MAG: rhodanese-like domain-containing protein [Dehalococcoidia bacterium]|nr:rhodanese-like domain-containing protein [Dehalococcoidia bacterium]
MKVTSQELVYEAGCRVPGMTVAEAELASSIGAQLVDVREAGEREESGIIPGSLHVPRGMLEFHADLRSPYYMAELDPYSPLTLYCANGARSALAAATLQRMGYQQVSYLDGGFAAWVNAGKRVAQPTSRAKQPV